MYDGRKHMTDLLTVIGEHPVMTVFLAIIMADFIYEVIKLFFRKRFFI